MRACMQGAYEKSMSIHCQLCKECVHTGELFCGEALHVTWLPPHVNTAVSELWPLENTAPCNSVHLSPYNYIYI
jgi:hypothetical protein